MNKTIKIDEKSLTKVFKETFTINATNPHGRASRREFWFFCIALKATLLLLLLFYITISDTLEPASNLNFLTLILLIVLFLSSIIPMIYLAIRRLHDMNLSGIFILFYLIPNIILLYFTICVRPSQNPDITHFAILFTLPYDIYYPLKHILDTVLPYIYTSFVLLLLLKAGTKGPNKYGPSPYETTGDAQQAQQETIKTESIPVEEVLFNNETGKAAGENIETEEQKKQKHLLDPNKPSYKV